MKFPKLLAVAVAAALCPTASPAQSGATATIVMSGLDNPRGLAFGPFGELYVAEAGRGGSGPCTILREQPYCYGPTGAISRLWLGRQERVVEGLPSYAPASGMEAVGPHDIAMTGFGLGYATIGLGADPAIRADFGAAGDGFGTLVAFSARGHRFGPFQRHLPGWSRVADISTYEAQHNPAGGPVDTNPYGLYIGQGRRLVTDAGANAVYDVAANGTVSLLAALRSRPDAATDAVPTEIERGPDGAYYVSELTGAPFADGSAVIYRIVPGQQPSVYAAGLKTVIDLAFARDGSLYFLQYATGPVFFTGPGQVWKIARDGSRSLVYSGLSQPTSLAIGPDGALYVSNKGAGTLNGEVLRIRLPRTHPRR